MGFKENLMNDEEYQEYVNGLIDTISMIERKEIASVMFQTMLDAQRHGLSKNDNELFASEILFSFVRGYIYAHTSSENPTPIQIAGACAGELDRYLNKLGDVLEEMDIDPKIEIRNKEEFIKEGENNGD
jgi:hypothetical protein